MDIPKDIAKQNNDEQSIMMANKTRVIMPHSALSDSNPLFYYYIPFHMRSCLILTCLCFPCHFESTFSWKRIGL